MTEQTKRTVVKSALKVIDLKDLRTDPSYQREVKQKHARIVTDFNEEALGIILIGEREDGTLWIVDGLQRVTALRKMGRQKVRAEVFASQGPEHEARVFKLVNLNRTHLNPREAFRALLAAHDARAWEIKEAVEGEGYRLTLGRSGTDAETAWREMTCVQTLQKIAERWGVPPIRFALRVAAECWPGDVLCPHNLTVSGLAGFFHRQGGVVDEERLLPRLKTVTPHKLIYAARQAGISNNMETSMVDIVAKVYQKRITQKRGG